jgi:hypothetical protein
MNGVSQRSFSLVSTDKTAIVMLIFMLLYCLDWVSHVVIKANVE